MSGDVNTSSGNITIVCALHLQYCLDHGLKPGIDLCLVDDGDDWLLIGEEETIRKLAEETGVYALFHWWRNYGYTMEVEKVVTVFEEIEFCQAQPVWNGIHWIMVRTLASLWKDTLCLVDKDKTELWLKLVSMAGLNVYGNIPVVAEHYRALNPTGERLSDRQVERLLRDSHLNQNGYGFITQALATPLVVASEISVETRLSYHRATRLDPYSQLILEDAYRRHHRGADRRSKNSFHASMNIDELRHQSWFAPSAY